MSSDGLLAARLRGSAATAATAAVVVLAALAVPPFLPPYWLSILILGVIFAILAMSLNLLMGFTGLDSLGQAAFFGTAAYVLGILTTRYGLGWGVGTAAGLVAATAVAAVFGLVAVRLKGLYFLLITVALGQVLWGAALRWGSLTGGWNGLRGLTMPADVLGRAVPYYYFALAVFGIVATSVWLIVHSPFGLVLRSIRERELRSSTLGYRTFVHKYMAFVIAGFIAALAGVLSATYNGFVSPRDLSLELSFDAMLMVILGGTGTLLGPVVGALVVTALRYLLSVYIDDYWLIVLGLVFIAATIWLPEGLVGVLRHRRRVPGAVAGEPVGRPAEAGTAVDGTTSSLPEGQLVPVAPQDQATPGPPSAAIGAEALVLEDVSMSFGDVTVLDDVDLVVTPGERTGIIGLNGAGKTTLFNVITGIHRPTGGSLQMLGQDVTRLPPYRRSALGLARTFQVTMLYPRLTALENIAIALMGRRHRRTQYVLWRRLSSMTNVGQQAREILDGVGLGDLGDVEVRYLSYGHQRQVEVALALAADPEVLLLDEPTAGLAQAEIPRMLRLLKALPEHLTILIVEHNLEVIFEIVTRVVVLHEGRVIMDGSPKVVRADPDVRQLYFGSRGSGARQHAPEPSARSEEPRR
jgi:ABC-type branched-subunit amino acid transport system ATPase component/ABC-type branched-subunit amino acid transport system permease subunit